MKPHILSGTFVKILCGICFSIVLAGELIAAENVFLKESVSAGELKIKGILTYTLQVVWQTIDKDVEIRKVTPPESDLLELAGSSVSASAEYIDGTLTRTKTHVYQYKALERGNGRLSGAQVEYVFDSDPDHIKYLEGRAFEVDVVAPGVIFRKKLLNISLKVIAGTLVLGSVLILIALLFRPRLKQARASPAGVANPEKDFLSSLRAIKLEQAQSSSRATLRDLAAALKIYLKEKYGMAIADLSDIGEGGKSFSDRQLMSLCASIGQINEKVSFGGYALSSDELSRVIRSCERHFQSSFPKTDPEDDIKLRPL